MEGKGQERLPLQGVRVADFTWAWAGPYATMLLALLGAEVIKVESKHRLDHARMRTLASGFSAEDIDSSAVFNDLNLNKMGITLDLKRPQAIDLARRLVSVCDVVAENFRPGVMDRLGLGYQMLRQVKTDIIMLSSSALGAVGPERNYIGFAPTFAAMGGAAHLTGFPDSRPVPLMGSSDLRSATTSAFSILVALYHRAVTGEGQHIDLSSTETIAVNIGDAIMDYFLNRRVAERQGNRDDIMAPHNCYPCRGKDAWVSIAVATDSEWNGLCDAAGHSEWASDDRFCDSYRRWNNQEELDRLIAEWTRGFTPMELMERLQRCGVAAVPSFHGTELFGDPHMQARRFHAEVTHPNLGRRITIAPPWHLSGTPASINRCSPLLGEHNEYVFGELLGMSKTEIDRFREEGVLS